MDGRVTKLEITCSPGCLPLSDWIRLAKCLFRRSSKAQSQTKEAKPSVEPWAGQEEPEVAFTKSRGLET